MTELQFKRSQERLENKVRMYFRALTAVGNHLITVRPKLNQERYQQMLTACMNMDQKTIAQAIGRAQDWKELNDYAAREMARRRAAQQPQEVENGRD